jgi:hypothetical protein
METQDHSQRSTSGAETLAGTLPFFVTGLWHVLSDVPAEWGLPTRLSSTADRWFLGWLLLLYWMEEAER